MPANIADSLANPNLVNPPVITDNPLLTPSIAVALGATVIEKHFTSNNDLPGRDNKFALNPDDFKIMCQNLSETSDMLSDHGNNFQESEKDIIENYRGRWG